MNPNSSTHEVQSFHQTTNNNTAVIPKSRITSHLQSHSVRYILLGVLVVLLLLCVLTRPDRTGNLFYYLLFLILWPIVAFLVILGFEWLILLYKFALFGSAGIAAGAIFLDETGIALISGTIAVVLLAIVIGISLMLLLMLFGPGALVGIGVQQALGGGTFATIAGLLVFGAISAVIFFVSMKIVIPFGCGLFVGTLSGTIVRDIVSAIFSVRQKTWMSLDLGRAFKQLHLNRLDFSGLEESLTSLFELSGRFFDAFFIGNWVIVLGSILLGIYFVVMAVYRERIVGKTG